jgi:DeoR/GlpR family transcriptional regulator of sugar metabolism
MLPNERQDELLRVLLTQGALKIADISQRLGVSEMTIRRDLERLEADGLVQRVHGGAIISTQNAFELSFARREMMHRDLKRLIGLAAATLVHDGDHVALDGSTTTLHVARNLRGRQNLTVVTNGIKVAIELGHIPGIHLFLTGGLLRDSISLVGPFATELAERIHVDKFIFSVAGIDLMAGLTDGNVPDAEVKMAFLRQSSEHILVAASPKFGRRSFVSLCPLTQVHKIVTDEGIPPQYAAALREQGIEIIVVARPESKVRASHDEHAA